MEEAYNLTRWVQDCEKEADLPQWAASTGLASLIAASLRACQDEKWEVAEKITQLGQQMLSTGKGSLRLSHILEAENPSQEAPTLSRGARIRIIIDVMKDLFAQDPVENQTSFPLSLFQDIVELARDEARQRRGRTPVVEGAIDFPFAEYREMMKQGVVYIRRWVEHIGIREISFQELSQAMEMIGEVENLTDRQTYEGTVAINWLLLQLQARRTEGLTHSPGSKRDLPAM